MTTSPTPSVLGRLRSVAPRRSHVTFDEALRVAELQASLLADLVGVRTQDLSEHHIASLPRIVVTHEDIGVSGTSHWNGQAWVIALSVHDSPARQRFTAFHEYKHIIDHGQTTLLYSGDRDRSAAQQAEAAADYFAGCVLVPKRDLKAAWGRGLQRPAALADHFGVSAQAITVRLAQTKLNVDRDFVPSPRCARPVRSPASRQRFRVPRPAYTYRSP